MRRSECKCGRLKHPVMPVCGVCLNESSEKPSLGEMLALTSPSKRYNEGKIQTREIDPAFILGIGEVLTKSREKYECANWMKTTPYSIPYESLMRHLMAFQSGEDLDKETGLPHLLHCATNLMFLHYHSVHSPESDDRLFKKKK